MVYSKQKMILLLRLSKSLEIKKFFKEQNANRTEIESPKQEIHLLKTEKEQTNPN